MSEPANKRGRWGGGAGIPPGMGVQAPDLQEVPPPPPPGAASQSAGQPDFSAAGVSAMSVAAAKAAAAKAAAAIQQQLHGMGSGADVNSKYPGMPPAWGVGMTEAQRDAAYAQHTRQSRRLYVGSLPKPVTDEALHAFFNNAMVNSGAAIDPSGGPPVVNTTITHEKGFAFIEFRRLEDAESALMFDGIVFNGSKLVIKRPKDYDAARNPIWAMRGQAPPQDEVKLIGEELPIGTIIVDGKEVKIPLPPPLPSEWPRLPRRTPNGPHKMYCGGFHPLHTDLQVRQVLQSVGELKSFAVMPDENGRPTGHAFFEYKDPRLSAVAEAVLTGIRVRNRRLVCRRMNPDAAPEKPGESATYVVPDAAWPLLEPASARLAVYMAIREEHDALARQEIEDAVHAEAARLARWDPDFISHKRVFDDACVFLEFKDGGALDGGDGGGGACGGNTAEDAAVRCSSGMNGRTFEGRRIYVRYLPPEGEEDGEAEAGEGAVAVVS